MFRRRKPIIAVIAALAMVALLAACGSPGAGPGGAGYAGVRYTEVGAKVGIRFTHGKPVFDSKIANIMPWVASLGASVAAADYNASGCQSLYVTNSAPGSKNHLYRNNCEGTFTDVAEETGLAELNATGAAMGAVWGDYLNSGCPALFVYKWGKSELFKNECNGTFTRVTDEAGVGYEGYPGKAMWWDFNRDGCLDLYLGNYFRPEINLWKLESTRFLHEDFEKARNGARNVLYKNNCDGTFTDVAPQMGLDDPGWTLSTGAADLNDDGWPDLYLANDFGPDRLFMNEGGKSFRAVRAVRGIADDTYKGMNVDFGDVYGDGRLSIYVTNITKPGFLLEGNLLWVLNGNNWENKAPDLNVSHCGWGWAAKFFDADNSGNMSLFTTNGFVSAGKKEYWYDLGIMATTPGLMVADSANWPTMGEMSLSGHEKKCLYLNQGKGSFKEIAQYAGITSTNDGRGVAVVDLFNRGTLDLVLANQNGPLQVYRSENSTGNHWLTLKLVGRPPSTRDAVGARVAVFRDNGKLVIERDGGHGFASQSDGRVHFGLGSETVAERIEIRWPSGRTQVLTNVAADQFITVEEPDTPIAGTQG